MSNTQGKLWYGLLTLFGLAFLAFLLTKNSMTAMATAMTGKKARPQRNNNPFAILQPHPSNWIGLAGKDGDGLLIFDSALNGVRAGFINLYNRYFSQGLNSINKIVPVYTGLSDWKGYANGLARVTGFGLDELITRDKIKHLGRGIERMEAGYQWVTDSDFDKGYNLATEYSAGHGSGGGGGGGW